MALAIEKVPSNVSECSSRQHYITPSLGLRPRYMDQTVYVCNSHNQFRHKDPWTMSAVSCNDFFGKFLPFCDFSCNISPLRKAGRPAGAYGAFRCFEPPFQLPDPPVRGARCLAVCLAAPGSHAIGLPWRVTHWWAARKASRALTPVLAPRSAPREIVRRYSSPPALTGGRIELPSLPPAIALPLAPFDLCLHM